MLTVEDDGKGFREQPPRPGVGLANMRDRIEALGGRCGFETATGGARLRAACRWRRDPTPGRDRRSAAPHAEGALTCAHHGWSGWPGCSRA